MVMQKAVEIANRFECDLHVLYVQPPLMTIPFLYDGNFSGTVYNNYTTDEIQQRMNELAREYKNNLAPGLQLNTEFASGNWYTTVKEQVITNKIDLVVIPKNEKKFLGALLYRININRLTLQTQCPVLTVTRDFNISHLQHIVVPVADFIPVRKLKTATYLARRVNGIIHLMGYTGDSLSDRDKSTKSLTRSYQFLQDYTNVQVYCADSTRSNTAEETLAYARKVKADLIVVNPGRETLLKGWLGKLMGKYLYKESNIPVLTVAPKQ